VTPLRNQANSDDEREGDAARQSVCMVLVTTPSLEKASEIAHTLLKASLIACANIVPGVRSMYTWNGELCDDSEALMLMKTRTDAFEAVKAHILAMHSYDLPEILQVDISAGHRPYLDWVLRSCTASCL